MPISRSPGRWILVGFATSAFLIAGCGQGPSERSEATAIAPRGDSKPSASAKSQPASQNAASGVELKAVKYDQLAEAIQAQRGKVVVMDVWAEY